MTTRRSAAAAAGGGGENARCPALQLVMEKGPLEGQISGYNPGTVVKIGRIARGNTLAIKDAGVSSKHLLIQVEPAPDGGRHCWTVTDLGSSNGTLLNGEQLEESEPAVLADGDVVKLGELTSIRVKFEPIVDESRSNSRNVRRNAKRGKGAAAELGIIDENSELGLGEDNYAENVTNLVPESINEKEKCLGGTKDEKLGTVVNENVGGRTTRGSAAAKLRNLDKVHVKVESVEIVSTRRTRSSRKEENSRSLMNKVDEGNENLRSLMNDVNEGKEDSEAEVIRGRNAKHRGTRSCKNNLGMSEDSNAEEDKDSGQNELDEDNEISAAMAEIEVEQGRNMRSSKNEAKGVQIASMRSTRSSRKEVSVSKVGIDSSVIDGKMTRKGPRGRKKLPPRIPEEKEELNLENPKGEEEERETEADGVSGLPSSSGVEKDVNGVGKGEVSLPDLETMTMGEWFDFLEWFLPKQIIDETEAMISELKRKAERLHKYKMDKKKC
ncbi:FHA domain-containing protein At4g14490 [Andrographis paniculata]|uniref:FHA domain-containing protein At4g14490 n=1 Tax=Andrographis paniculata TaxID=175694 RepID=UPI0021E7FC8F|nr:FHA domain-containing protein At4g14490 [Andrographis paniculata]